MTIKEKIQERYNNSKNSILPENIKRNNHGAIEEVNCWCCGAVVAGWVDSEITKTESVNGVHKVYIRQRFTQFGNYTKAQYVLSDGSNYTPIVCKNCVDNCDMQTGESIYSRDLMIRMKDGVEEKELERLSLLEIRELKNAR